MATHNKFQFFAPRQTLDLFDLDRRDESPDENDCRRPPQSDWQSVSRRKQICEAAMLAFEQRLQIVGTLVAKDRSLIRTDKRNALIDAMDAAYSEMHKAGHENAPPIETLPDAVNTTRGAL